MAEILKDTFFKEFKARYQFSKSKLVCKFNFELFLTLPVPSLNIFGFGFCISMVVRNLKPGSLDLILRPIRELYKGTRSSDFSARALRVQTILNFT